MIVSWVNSQLEKVGRVYWILNKGFPLRLWFCDVDPRRVPKGTVFPHPMGIVIARNTVLGSYCTIYQNVTLGTNPGDPRGPVLGDRVTVYPYSAIIGPRNIGSGAVIGAGSIVFRDVLPQEIVKCYA